jgi:hypothetical protein
MAKVAHEEWASEHNQLLSQILQNAGTDDTICVDGREIPNRIVTQAFKQIIDEEK